MLQKLPKNAEKIDEMFLQNLPIFKNVSLNFAQSVMKFCRNFANIFENVEQS